MLILDARLDGEWLQLKVKPYDVLHWLNKFKAGEYEITRHTNKRSLNANSYAWALIGKIAAKINIPSTEIYRRQIADIGGKTTCLSVPIEAVDDFKTAFIDGHIGRDVQLIGYRNGNADLYVVYGSSSYDVHQMQQLLDNIIQDCKALGIETASGEYINSLLSDWEKTHG